MPPPPPQLLPPPSPPQPRRRPLTRPLERPPWRPRRSWRGRRGGLHPHAERHPLQPPRLPPRPQPAAASPAFAAGWTPIFATSAAAAAAPPPPTVAAATGVSSPRASPQWPWWQEAVALASVGGRPSATDTLEPCYNDRSTPRSRRIRDWRRCRERRTGPVLPLGSAAAEVDVADETCTAHRYSLRKKREGPCSHHTSTKNFAERQPPLTPPTRQNRPL